MSYDWDDTDGPQTKAERALAGGAVGGLIGLIFGPLGTLACTVIGAGLGYATSYRVDRRGLRNRRHLVEQASPAFANPEALLGRLVSGKNQGRLL
jgi:hypothetical protein